MRPHWFLHWQVKFWNIPLITPGGLSSDFSRKDLYALVTRIGANFNSLVSFLIAMLQEFHWSRMLLGYDSEAQSNILERFCHVAANGIHYGIR